MATQSNDLSEVALLIGGVAHTLWSRYRIDSDLQTPADAWELAVWPSRDAAVPAADPNPVRLLSERVKTGASVKLLVDGQLVMTGAIDAVEHSVDKGQVGISITGRDKAAVLVDCAAPLVAMRQATLSEIIRRAVAPFDITQVAYRVTLNKPNLKVHTEPGQSVWDWLQAACEAHHAWPWMEPDGTLVIGEPDYETPPVATLVLRFDGRDNNVLRISRNESLHSRFSEVTVLGQMSGDGEDGQHGIKGLALDEELRSRGIFRPKVVMDGNAGNTELANLRAEKIMADGKMQGERLSVTARGHYASAGLLWKAGQRVLVQSEPHGVNGIYFVMRRTFSLSKQEGQTTELDCIVDGTWLLNIAKIKGKRRNDTGKKNLNYLGRK